ncbi:MAG: hypothetical protein JXA11_03185 [Phycisphaerae bacterium]|nr:hypothetical protein [Phycisphaerae bacterium]
MSNRPPEELIERHEAFLACAPTDRPLLGGWLGGYFPAEQFPRGTSRWHVGQKLEPDDVRLESFAEDYENLFRIHRDVDDDFFHVGSAYWGVPWLEAILGCPVVVGETTCWAESFLSRPDAPAARMNLDDNPWFHCLLRFTRELVDLSAGRFPVCPPLLRGPGDAAAAMRGAMNLIPEYTDAPDGVRGLLEYGADVRLEVIRRLNDVIPPWHGTYAAGGYPSKIWSKRTVAYHQEDSAALLSPKLFREFLLPLERRLCRAAEVNFIHLHSSCLWPVDALLEDGCFDVLEINIDHEGAGPAMSQLIPTFQKIQAHRTPLLLWGEFSEDDWQCLRKELNPAGLSLQPMISEQGSGYRR